MDDQFDAWLELELQELQSIPSAGNKCSTPTLMPAANPPAVFHDTKTRVYNAIPREKQVEAIKLIAAAAAAKTPACAASAGSSTAVSVEMRRYFLLQSSTTWSYRVSGSAVACDLQDELPMARRQSLQRFLEKRRERFLSKLPYASPKFPYMEDDLGSSSKSRSYACSFD